MTKSLTDKWKDGELPSGYYYLTDGKETYIHEYIKSIHKIVSDRFTFLAPVPSYDEYQGLLSDNLALDEATEINAELEQKVEKLQEQLKEANEILMMPDNIKYHDEVVEMLNNYSKKWGVK